MSEALQKLAGYKKQTNPTKIFTKLANYGYDLSELQPAVEQQGNKLVITCAGSGKTTMLCVNVLHDLEAGQYQRQVQTSTGLTKTEDTQVWVGTFSASGAKTLANTLEDYASMLGIKKSRENIRVSTLHAEFKKVIEEAEDAILHAQGSTLRMLDDKTNERILRRVLTKKNDIHLQQEEFKKFYTALMYTRASLKPEKMYQHEGYKVLKDKNNIETIEKILDDWALAREHYDDSGAYDFEDLQDILYVRLSSPEDYPEYDWREAIASRYSHILMDEFQDTSDKQLYILRHYAQGEGFKKIIAVGDDDQMIYSWRGSSTTVITKDFEEYFKPTVVKLTKNRRCSAGVLFPVIPSIEKNPGRYPKSITTDIEGGSTHLIGYNSLDWMGKDLLQKAKQDVAVGRTVAVLCRDNRSGLLPSLLFQSAISSKGTGVDFRISGVGMSLASRTGQDATSILSLINHTSDELVRPLSNLLGSSFRSPEVRCVVDRCRETMQTVWELMDDDPEGFQYSANKLWRKLEPLKAKREELEDKEFAMFLCDFFVDEVWDSPTSDNQLQLRSLCQALRVLVENSEYFTDAVKTVHDLGGDIRERINNLRAKISIATVHDFKGKEADSVYLWDDTVGVFPKEDSLNMEEERRLHYIACTRARKDLTIMYRSGSKAGPGRFVREMDMSLMKHTRPAGDIGLFDL